MSDRLAVIFADGGSRGNPGPAGAGAVIKSGSDTIAELKAYVGRTTNNVAEYTGLLIGLKRALELGFESVEVRMDSELIVRQINGQYRVKNDKLIPMFQEAKGLIGRFSQFRISHVPRELNKDADRLANQAMDEAAVLKGL